MFRWATIAGPVMGVVNVTPDSFSDGGRFDTPNAAVAHAHELATAGAAVLDIGGESTRPGAEPVDASTEIERVVPVIAALAGTVDVPISVDTTKAAVATTALAAGATIVNDVSAGTADRDMLDVVAAAGAGYVAMHMQGEPRTMQARPHYDDVVGEVAAFLVDRLDAARDRRGPGRRADGRSRHRLRQDTRAQPRAARVVARAHRRGGCARAHRHVAQGLPRPHRRRGRSRGARRRDPGHGGVGARAGRGDGARARRPRRGAGRGGPGSDGARASVARREMVETR